MRSYSFRWFNGRRKMGERKVRARNLFAAILKVAGSIPATAKVAVTYSYGGRRIRAI